MFIVVWLNLEIRFLLLHLQLYWLCLVCWEYLLVESINPDFFVRGVLVKLIVWTWYFATLRDQRIPIRGTADGFSIDHRVDWEWQDKCSLAVHRVSVKSQSSIIHRSYFQQKRGLLFFVWQCSVIRSHLLGPFHFVTQKSLPEYPLFQRKICKWRECLDKRLPCVDEVFHLAK